MPPCRERGQGSAIRREPVQTRVAGGRRSGGTERPSKGGLGGAIRCCPAKTGQLIATEVELKAGSETHPAIAMQPVVIPLQGCEPFSVLWAPFMQSSIEPMSEDCAISALAINSHGGAANAALWPTRPSKANISANWRKKVITIAMRYLFRWQRSICYSLRRPPPSCAVHA